MLEFNELRITPDGKKLIVDVSVKDLSYYNDVYIDAIIIDTQDTYVVNGPSSNPIFKYEAGQDAYILKNFNLLDYEERECFTGLGEADPKRLRLVLDNTTLGASINDNLFFVYAIAKGTPAADTPCGMDNATIMRVVANLYPFYRSMVNYMKEVEDTCSIPKTFIDSLLRFKALDLSIRTGHYTQAIKYWNKFFKDIKNKTINTGCKCNGGT